MNRDEFERLLALNYAVANATAKKKLKGQEFVYTETLAVKLFFHAVTSFALWTQHTKVQVAGMDVQVHFIDWSSIEVLARACVETYLAFHYLYIEPDTDDELEFRYNAWMLAGFAKRESFPVTTDKARKQFAIDARVNEKHRKRIRKTAHFQRLSPKVQDRVLEGRNWHPGRTLSQMASRVFGPEWGPALYALGSSHAHSDALSVVQIKQSGSLEATQRLADGAMSQIGITLAHMTTDYSRRFVKARKVLAKHPDRQLNHIYANVAQYVPTSIGTENDGL